VKVDSDYYDSPFHTLNPTWSPDSKWLAYTKQLVSHLHAVYIYGSETAKSNQVTDGFSDAVYADWDKGGKYLYLTASTDCRFGCKLAGHVQHRPSKHAQRLPGSAVEG
jgi:tricorn protease